MKLLVRADNKAVSKSGCELFFLPRLYIYIEKRRVYEKQMLYLKRLLLLLFHLMMRTSNILKASHRNKNNGGIHTHRIVHN
jgi:uncharacterized membrane protein